MRPAFGRGLTAGISDTSCTRGDAPVRTLPRRDPTLATSSLMGTGLGIEERLLAPARGGPAGRRRRHGAPERDRRKLHSNLQGVSKLLVDHTTRTSSCSPRTRGSRSSSCRATRSRTTTSRSGRYRPRGGRDPEVRAGGAGQPRDGALRRPRDALSGEKRATSRRSCCATSRRTTSAAAWSVRAVDTMHQTASKAPTISVELVEAEDMQFARTEELVQLPTDAKNVKKRIDFLFALRASASPAEDAAAGDEGHVRVDEEDQRPARRLPAGPARPRQELVENKFKRRATVRARAHGHQGQHRRVATKGNMKMLAPVRGAGQAAQVAAREEEAHRGGDERGGAAPGWNRTNFMQVPQAFVPRAVRDAVVDGHRVPPKRATAGMLASCSTSTPRPWKATCC